MSRNCIMKPYFKIYIEKKTVNNQQLYRVFVEHSNSIIWVGGYVSEDNHQKIYSGKIVQSFANNKASIQLENKQCLYVDRKFKWQKINVGEKVLVQAHSISVQEMDDKNLKGTLNIAMSCGPVIIYPFETGIHVSNRLKQYPEVADALKKHFAIAGEQIAIKFRAGAKDYSEKLLENILIFLRKTWIARQYNQTELFILNDLIKYFLYPSELYTNDLSLQYWFKKNIKDIFHADLSVKTLPEYNDILEDAWDCACQTSFILEKGISISIEETLACVAIDINTGSEPSFYQANKSAVEILPKILYQGRIGGKIVVDLLPMSSRQETEKISNLFEAVSASYDISLQNFGISKMGLLEFILPRRGYPLWWIDKKILKI